jgi:hypothetical protein
VIVCVPLTTVAVVVVVAMAVIVIADEQDGATEVLVASVVEVLVGFRKQEQTLSSVSHTWIRTGLLQAELTEDTLLCSQGIYAGRLVFVVTLALSHDEQNGDTKGAAAFSAASRTGDGVQTGAVVVVGKANTPDAATMLRMNEDLIMMKRRERNRDRKTVVCEAKR